MASVKEIYRDGVRARQELDHLERAGFACKAALERHPDSDALKCLLPELRKKYRAQDKVVKELRTAYAAAAKKA